MLVILRVVINTGWVGDITGGSCDGERACSAAGYDNGAGFSGGSDRFRYCTAVEESIVEPRRWVGCRLRLAHPVVTGCIWRVRYRLQAAHWLSVAAGAFGCYRLQAARWQLVASSLAVASASPSASAAVSTVLLLPLLLMLPRPEGAEG